MTTSTRTCDAPNCGLVATFTQLTRAVAKVSWADGSTETLSGLPTDGTIRCPAHRAGWCHNHVCREGFPHSTSEAASTCSGHGHFGAGGGASGAHPPGDET
jgi:hypothetical protein